MDWATAEDSKAPPGWKLESFDGEVENLESCANGWNAYAPGESHGHLMSRMRGSGRATVKYKDCLGEGFIALYLNDRRIDNSPDRTGELRTFRF